MALDYLKSNSVDSANNINTAPSQSKDKHKNYYTKLTLLIIAFVVVCFISFNLWAPKIVSSTTSVKSGLTAIMHDAKRPSAIIDGQIVHVGDVLGNRKVVCIDRNQVMLQKGKKTYQMKLK